MAVSKDDLVINISADTVEYDKALEDSQKKTSFLQSAIDALSDEIKRFSSVAEGSMRSYENSLDAVNKSIESMHDISSKTYGILDAAMASFAAFAGIKVVSKIVSANQAFEMLNSTVSKVPLFLNAFSKSTLGIGVSVSSAIVGLGLLGSALEKSNNDFVRITGTVIKLAAIVSGGLSAMLLSLASFVGGIFEKAGLKMQESIQLAIAEFDKFEDATRSLNFVIKALSKTFSNGLGNNEQWRSAMDDLRSTTLYTTADITSSVMTLVKAGATIGLSFEQQVTLLKRSADIAASSGKSLDSVVSSLLGSLQSAAPQELSLVDYGVDVSNAAVSTSKYIKTIGLSVNQLDRQGLAQARLNTVLEQTDSLTGAAADRTKTIAGGQQQLNKIIIERSIEIGKYSILTRNIIALQIKIESLWERAPEPIIAMIAVLQDFGSVALIVIGKILKLTFYISAMAAVVGVFNIAFGTTISLFTTFLGVAKYFGAFFAVLLVFNEAFAQLNEGSTAFAETIESIKSTFSETEKEVKKSADSFSFLESVFRSVVSFAKIPLVGLVQIILELSKGIVHLRKIFASDDDELAWALVLDDLDSKINNLSGDSTKSLISAMTSFGESSAIAASGSAQVADTTKIAAEAMKKYKENILSTADSIGIGFDVISERAKITEDDLGKLYLDSEKTKKELDKIFRSNIPAEDAGKKLAELRTEAIKLEIDSEKLRFNIYKKNEEGIQSLNAKYLNDSGRKIDAIKEETAYRIKQIEAEEAGLIRLGKYRLEDRILVDERIRQEKKSRDSAISGEQEKHLEKINDLKKTIAQINAEIYGFDKNEIVSIKLKTEAKLEELRKTEQQLRASNDLSKKAKSLLSIERESLALAEKTRIQNVMKDAYDEILKKTDDLKAQSLDLNATQQEKLKHELDGQLKLIELEKERLKVRGLLPTVGAPTEEQSRLIEGFEAQKKALTEINALKSKAAPSQEFEAAKMVGDDIAQSITGAFKGGAMGMMEGFGSVLDAVQGLIDFIPNMLSKIEHVLTSLTELPAKILAGVQGVFSAALKFVSDFIPNIAASAEKIIKAAIDFLTKLPDVFATLLSKLPDIILGLVDRLPELVKKFANALVASGPKITMSLVKSLIKNGPHIAKNIAWMLAVELPKAIAEGIWDALKQVLSGKFNLADMFDTSSISDTFKKIGTALTGEASRLFSVTDFGTGTESIQQTALQTANAINKAFNDGVNLLMKAWKWLLDMVINPLINGLRAVWLWIYDTIIQPIFNGLKAVWSWVYDTIISPFINALTSAWNAIKSGIIDPLINGLSNAANGLRDALKPLIGAGQNIVNGIKDGLNAILSKISDAFYNIGKNLVKGLVDSLGSIGGVIGKAIGGLPSVSVSIPSFFAHGGIVGGAANVVGNSYRNDTIPAMLSPGEAVIPRSAMRDPAIAEAVKAILSGGGISRFANGMMPSLSPAASQSSIELGGITINTTQSIDADFVRLKLMPTIQKELRRASLDGQTVIYKTGVR